MGNEPASPEPTDVFDSEIDAEQVHNVPRSALDSALGDTIASQNTRVLHGWLVDSEAADHRAWMADDA